MSFAKQTFASENIFCLGLFHLLVEVAAVCWGHDGGTACQRPASCNSAHARALLHPPAFLCSIFARVSPPSMWPVASNWLRERCRFTFAEPSNFDFFFHKHLHRIVNDSQSWETLIHEVIWMTTQVVVILSFDILHVVDLSIFEFLFHFSAAFTFEEFFRFIMDKSPPSKTFTNRPILSEWVLEERNSQFILIEYHRQISIAFIFCCINLQSSNSLSLFKNPHPLQLVIAQDFHRFSWDWVFQVFSYDKILFFDIYCWFGAMSLCYCFADYSLTSFLIASKIYFVEVDRFSLIWRWK